MCDEDDLNSKNTYDPDASTEQRMRALLNSARKDVKEKDYVQALVSVKFVFEHLHLLPEKAQTDVGQKAAKILEHLSSKDIDSALYYAKLFSSRIPGIYVQEQRHRALKLLLSGPRKKHMECMYQAAVILEQLGSVKEALYYVRKTAAM
jgi:hypothetical protein